MDTRIVMPELPLDSLVLTPDSVTIPVGDSVQLTATLWAGGVIVGCSGDCVSIEVNSRIQNVFLALRDNRPVEIELQATTVGKHTILADGRPMLAINSIGRPILAIESSEKKLFFTTPAGRN
jgi:hypothetical protein